MRFQLFQTFPAHSIIAIQGSDLFLKTHEVTLDIIGKQKLNGEESKMLQYFLFKKVQICNNARGSSKKYRKNEENFDYGITYFSRT